MTSEERPFSLHDPEDRECEFCGEMFYAHHGLQRYCPEKFGKKDYCKNQQKKLMNEKRLADRVIELTKSGINLSLTPPLEKNKQILNSIMGFESMKIVSSNDLDLYGFDIRYYDYRIPKNDTEMFVLYVGDYNIEWIDFNETLLTFKITRK
jgi:hypothetical protein